MHELIDYIKTIIWWNVAFKHYKLTKVEKDFLHLTQGMQYGEITSTVHSYQNNCH